MRTLALLMLTFNVIPAQGTGPSGHVPDADPETTGTRISRVRSHRPELGDVIRRASDAPATFQRLIATIDGTDGLIYVDDDKTQLVPRHLRDTGGSTRGPRHSPGSVQSRRPVARSMTGQAHLRAERYGWATFAYSHERRLEAPPGFEPGMEVLQISQGWLCC